MSDNSGSAFPSGMSLRDYFAGQALGNLDSRGIEESAAKWCYEMADAMLKEREKNGE